jgi:hypothetical protein
MWARVRPASEEALREELDGLRLDEMRLLDEFVQSGRRTIDLPLSDYAADSLARKSLITCVGRPTAENEQRHAIPDAVWSAWGKRLRPPNIVPSFFPRTS